MQIVMWQTHILGNCAPSPTASMLLGHGGGEGGPPPSQPGPPALPLTNPTECQGAQALCWHPLSWPLGATAAPALP